MHGVQFSRQSRLGVVHTKPGGEAVHLPADEGEGGGGVAEQGGGDGPARLGQVAALAAAGLPALQHDMAVATLGH